MQKKILKVALDTPLDTTFDYRWTSPLPDSPQPQPGQFVRVPFGRRETVGLILRVSEQTDLEEHKIRDVIEVRHALSPVSAQ